MTAGSSHDPRRPVRPYRGVSAEQRIAERRASLLDAGLQEFGTRGVTATGIKDLCRTAGVADRYFYESFTSTGELFTAVFDRATAQLFTVVAQALAAAPADVDAQVRAVIEAYVGELAGDARLARVVFVEAPSAGPEVEQHMRATLRVFARFVEEAGAPFLPDDMPRDVVRFGATALVGAIERLMIEWQDGELGLTVEQIIEYLVGMLIAARQVAERTMPKPSEAS